MFVRSVVVRRHHRHLHGHPCPGAAGRAGAEAANVAVGLNWYLNPYVRWLVTAERTVFDGDADGPRPAENALLFRAQLAF